VRLTVLEILGATHGGQVGGTLVGNSFTTFHTDSREVEPGGVFFALRGGETDGHRFIDDAIARGAGALVVERAARPIHGVGQIVVGDTWRALFDLSAYVLARVKPLVVGVTGSNGKTSTKEMVAAALSARFKVLRTAGNLNTETGVPLTILRLEAEHTAVVVEMGLQRAGDIGRLVALARPSIGVITNIGAVHLEYFATQEDLARAKGELVSGLPPEGRAVLNADDAFYRLLQSISAAPVSSFGVESGDYRVEGYRPLPAGGCEFTMRSVSVRLALDGRHQALNAAAALAAADFAGVPPALAAPGLATLAVDHRLQDRLSPAGYIVVDDAYNASPESMEAAFAAVAARPRQGRLLAVLGDMRELGEVAETAHERVGRRAAEVFDAVAVVDTPLGRVLAGAARADVVPDNKAAAGWVRAHARAGDRVLVKASHSQRFGEVVTELTT
jgi:UDP-N-acetylmuramoyl-tripeptide--D-alanyl-D-alanine ligase